MKRRKAGNRPTGKRRRISNASATKPEPKSEVLVFDQSKEVRAIARERVGIVKPAQVIIPKSERKPKHKKKVEEEET